MMSKPQLGRSTWQLQNPKNMMLNNARARARKKGLPFELCLRDISIPDVCPILGIPLTFAGPRSDNSPALDRIRPELGYVPKNVLVISDKANRIKTNATASEISAVADWLRNNYPENK